MRRFLGLFLVVSTIVSILATSPAGANVAVDEFGTPSANSGPEGITMGPDGNLWYTECKLGNVGNLTPSKPPSFEFEYSVGGCPNTIAAGPDGNLWFTDGSGPVGGTSGNFFNQVIGRITTAGAITEFPFPAVAIPSGYVNEGIQLNGITAGPDGNLWFTAFQQAYEVNPTANWNYQMIGQITPSGVITLFPISETHTQDFGGPIPEGITSGPDGNLWFTQNEGDESLATLGQITTGGVITLFSGTFGIGITVWQGALWTTGGTFIGRFNTSGSGTTIPLPVGSPAGGGLAPEDCSNNLWFTSGLYPTKDPIGVINNLFQVTQYKTPTTNSQPQSIAAGGTAPTGSPRRTPARSVGSSTRSPRSPVSRTSRARSS